MSDPHPIISTLRHHEAPDGLVIVSNGLLLAAADAIETAEARAVKAEAEAEQLRAEIDEMLRRALGNLNKIALTLRVPADAVVENL